MLLKNYKPVLHLFYFALAACVLHKAIFYFLKIDVQKFHYSIEFLYLIFFALSALLYLILIIVKKKNFEIISSDTRKENLTKLIIADHHPYNLRIIQKDDEYLLLKQIPNSYHLFGLDRLPLKYRPKCLRILDKNILANLSKKKYDTKNGCLTSDNNKTMSSYV